MSFFFSIYKGVRGLSCINEHGSGGVYIEDFRVVFLRSSERDPVFNDVAGRSTLFIPFLGWILFFSMVLSRLFPRTDRLRNWVVKAERDMIVYQRRTGSSPCIWRLANLGAYCAIICCSSFSILMNSSPKLLSYALPPLYYPLLFA